jgi:hypothetical protein
MFNYRVMVPMPTYHTWGCKVVGDEMISEMKMVSN